jgi:energy-coupling factor transport system ATP-binding protein
MSAPLIAVRDLAYTYAANGERPIEALRGVDLDVAPGEYLAVIGHNGSGKSTLARCLNGLLRPTAGHVRVRIAADGTDLAADTADGRYMAAVRATVGIVLQDPDNQFVASTVLEEVAFGPENLGLPRLELRERVEWALAQTGLGDWRERNPRALSAGQKARLAVAGMLAMRPACLVLDESTALLDPLARGEMCALLARLHAGGMAIVAITHFMEEAAAAQRLLVLSAGRIALQGTPRQVFAHEALGLGLPPAAAVAHGLRRRGVPLPGGLLTAGELAAALAAVREGISPGETVASGGVEW